MFKNALVSVSDKTGLDKFLAPLAAQGMRIVSSGGTAKYLEDKGLSVTKVSEQTGFPEVMGGRVKTLHPNVHMPLLYRPEVSDDFQTLEKYGLQPFDLVVVNLYPFAKGLETEKPFNEMIELIDIGGPTLMRAAAKNHQSVCVVIDPDDYSWILSQKEINLDGRKKLAAKVYRSTSSYDHKIASYLEGQKDEAIEGTLHQELRYGENPQQKGQWFKQNQPGLQDTQIIQGKPLSYNNLLDLDGACRTLQFFSEPTVVSVKHNNPCGVATDSEISIALEKSLKADPMSVFGGIIASNRQITGECAQKMTGMFLECIVASDYSAEALEVFSAKKNLRILKWDALKNSGQRNGLEFRSIEGGFLQQTQDFFTSAKEWKVIGEVPSEAMLDNIEFAWKVCASLKSNAIAICSNGQTIGLGMGQVNRVDAVKQAIERAKQFHPNSQDWILASDAFFPFPDSVELAGDAGIRWVVQPGGSVKDDEVFARGQEMGINFLITGQRHFRH